MLRTALKITLFLLWIAVPSLSDPGLLKVPKVYNALITSDQNLAPSRAFPVVQPVIHRTAVGYLPPTYYPQFTPQFVPEVIDVSKLAPPSVAFSDVQQLNGDDNLGYESSSKEPIKNEEDEKEEEEEKKPVPLKFFPNLKTLLYDPYFYTYSGLGWRADDAAYDNQQSFDPLPPEINRELLPPSPQDEETSVENEERIPDVPPPPVPISMPKLNKTS